MAQGDKAHNRALVSILLGPNASLGTQNSGCGLHERRAYLGQRAKIVQLSGPQLTAEGTGEEGSARVTSIDYCSSHGF